MCRLKTFRLTHGQGIWWCLWPLGHGLKNWHGAQAKWFQCLLTWLLCRIEQPEVFWGQHDKEHALNHFLTAKMVESCREAAEVMAEGVGRIRRYETEAEAVSTLLSPFITWQRTVTFTGESDCFFKVYIKKWPQMPLLNIFFLLFHTINFIYTSAFESLRYSAQLKCSNCSISTTTAVTDLSDELSASA